MEVQVGTGQDPDCLKIEPKNEQYFLFVNRGEFFSVCHPLKRTHLPQPRSLLVLLLCTREQAHNVFLSYVCLCFPRAPCKQLDMAKQVCNISRDDIQGGVEQRTYYRGPLPKSWLLETPGKAVTYPTSVSHGWFVARQRQPCGSRRQQRPRCFAYGGVFAI